MGFFELSLDANGIFANLTFVDFVALRCGQPGLERPDLDPGGKAIRVLSPNTAANAAAWTGRLDGYLNPYINQVWQKYRSTDLHINTQSSRGTVVGRVGADGQLRFPRVGASPSRQVAKQATIGPYVARRLEAATIGIGHGYRPIWSP